MNLALSLERDLRPQVAAPAISVRMLGALGFSAPSEAFLPRPDGDGTRVSTWLWVVLAIAAIVVVAVVLLGATKGRQRRVEKKREEAAELRQEAQERVSGAGRREAVAQQEAERARREREAAEEAARRADEIDPDVP